MVRKSLLSGLVLVASIVAWGQAQERPLPSILRQPAPLPATGVSDEPRRLSSELERAGAQVAVEHQVPRPLDESAPRSFAPSEPRPLPAGPAAVRPVSLSAQDGQQPAVPSILSGRSGSTPRTAPPASAAPANTPPASTLPAGAAPRTPAAPMGTSTMPPMTLLRADSPSQTGSIPSNAAAPNTGLGPNVSAQGRAAGAAAGARPIGISMRGPTLRVDVSGPESIAVGKDAMFEVLVTNAGPMAGENILVAVDFPAHVGIVSAEPSDGEVEQTDGTQMARVIWTVAQVAAGGQQKLMLKLMPQQNAAFDMNCEWTLMPLTGTAKIEVTQPALAMKVTGPSEVLFGQEASFRFDVTNSGTGAAENVVVSLPAEMGGDQKELGTIPPGETRAFALEIAAAEAGAMSIGAIASADGGLRQEASADFIVRRARLDVATVGPDFKYAGTVATYELTIVNAGDAPATGVIAAAALPAGAQYVDGVEGAEQIEGGLRWQIGQLAPGERRSYAIRCILEQAGELQFEAGARAEGEIQGADAVATVVEAVADLALAVDDPKGPKPVGDEVIYTLRITNRGSKAATDVKLLCQFSDGIEPTSTSGHPAELVPGQAMFRPIARIDAGQELVIEVRAKATKEGNHVFRAELTCDTPETRRVFEGTTKFFGSARSSTTSNLPSTIPAAGPTGGAPALPSSGPSLPPSTGPSLPPSSGPSLPPSSSPGLTPRGGSNLPLAPPSNGGGGFRPGRNTP